MVLDQLREIGVSGAQLRSNLLAENPRPPLTLAALAAGAEDPIPVVSSADQTITQAEVLHRCPVPGRGRRHRRHRDPGSSLTSPETGYGYIKTQGSDVVPPGRTVRR